MTLETKRNICMNFLKMQEDLRNFTKLNWNLEKQQFSDICKYSFGSMKFESDQKYPEVINDAKLAIAEIYPELFI